MEVLAPLRRLLAPRRRTSPNEPASSRPVRAQRPEFVLPSSVAMVPDYKDAFEQTIEFTKFCGFNTPSIIWSKRDVLLRNFDFANPALCAAGVLDASASAFQCLKWCHFLTPFFERELGLKVWLTVGQIWKGNVPIFNPSWEDLRRWSQQGIQLSDFEGRKGFNLHAWLTLKSGEIIDPTLFSTLARVHEGFAEVAGTIVGGRDPTVIPGHRYFPMVVGNQFIEALAGHSAMPLLAQNATELHYVWGVSVIRPL